MSVFSNELAYNRVISAGANGFITKSSAGSDLKKAIFCVMKSRQYFQNNFSAIYRERQNGNVRSGKNQYSLTDEEIMFLKLICTDKPYDAIASDMKTSIRHEDYLRQGFFEKYDLHSRADLALLVYNSGIGS
jgi:DNA-binding NarL/FixJ family response regulator